MTPAGLPKPSAQCSRSPSDISPAPVFCNTVSEGSLSTQPEQQHLLLLQTELGGLQQGPFIREANMLGIML